MKTAAPHSRENFSPRGAPKCTTESRNFFLLFFPLRRRAEPVSAYHETPRNARKAAQNRKTLRPEERAIVNAARVSNFFIETRAASYSESLDLSWLSVFAYS